MKKQAKVILLLFGVALVCFLPDIINSHRVQYFDTPREALAHDPFTTTNINYDMFWRSYEVIEDIVVLDMGEEYSLYMAYVQDAIDTNDISVLQIVMPKKDGKYRSYEEATLLRVQKFESTNSGEFHVHASRRLQYHIIDTDSPEITFYDSENYHSCETSYTDSTGRVRKVTFFYTFEFIENWREEIE